ncbi:MAG: peptidylprolyl isomerase [Desulfurivibrio sp.]|nr:peptidylprolyl isomerase [Desulfurivibrio sp.]MBU3936468.1 peptidylprolyl isomerase [Pseudomonadota bacterium]MBU4118241.1 peptidylprolyl isomerase [Pseudomonadota bacterium]
MQFGKFHKAVLISFALGATVVFATSVWSKSEKKAEEVAVLVNGQPIAAAAVQGEIKGILGRFQEQGRKPSDTEMASLRESVLEKMIKLELLSQESKKAGVSVSATDIDNELKVYKKGFADDKSFAKALGEAGITEGELRKQIGKNLTIQKFIDTKFKGKAQVTEQEAKDFYNNNQDKFVQPEMAHARHILITAKETEPKADKDRKRAKLVQIKKQLKDGADFAELAKQFSDCPSKERGGDLGFFPRGQMVKPFEQAVFKMMPGDVSDVVETEFGFHLIKLEEKKPAKTVSFDEAKAKITAYLTQEKVTGNIEAFLAETKAKATIKILSPQAKK